MRLYAQRLNGAFPGDVSASVSRLPRLPGDSRARVSEVLMPPLVLPFVRSDIAHVIDHAHAAYLRWLRVPTVVTVHDLIPLKLMNGEYRDLGSFRMGARARYWFRKNIDALARADLLTVPSDATRRDVERLLGLPSRVVHLGVDEAFFEPGDEAARGGVLQRFGLAPGARYVLQVTNGFFYKNHPSFVKAFAALAREFPDLKWVRVGPAPTREEAGQARSLGVDGRLVLVSGLSVGDLVAVYRGAAALLYPSLDEGFGWPPLEAMAAGCPVVSSAIPVLEETSGAAALTAPPEDVAALSAQVASILEDDQFGERLRAAGRARALRFNWRSTGEATAALYRELLE